MQVPLSHIDEDEDVIDIDLPTVQGMDEDGELYGFVDGVNCLLP
jgi:hypothetical protein